jgi:hypothetical protein
MRLACVVLCVILILNSPLLSSAQQATTTAPIQASTLLQSALSALSGGQTLTDVALTGAANSIAGSYNETGKATLKSVVGGGSSLNLSLPSGQHNEIVNTSQTPPVGSWTGPDGNVHEMAFHNLLVGPFWFFPVFALTTSSTAQGAVVSYVGAETRNGEPTLHLTITQSLPFAAPPNIPSYAHLTQLDFFLDSTTLLPAALDFNIHPDNDETLDIPVEIRFTSYTTVNGAQIPFHIQKFINNTLSLDLQIQSATLNSGISVSSFAAQ